MKKVLFLLLAALIVSQSSVYSAAVEKITEERGYISSSAEKTKDVYPNIAEVTFTKETTAKTIEAASTENKTVIAEITKALQTYKQNNANTTEIRTGNYTANPNYVYKGNKKQLTGYTVINSITVRTKSTDLLGKMIDSAIKAGVDRVGSLSFSYENDGSICKELIYQATQETQTYAQVAATSSHQIIKGIKSMHTSCYTQMNNTTNFRNYAKASMAMSADGASESAPETTITPGKIKVRANVNAEFYVK